MDINLEQGQTDPKTENDATTTEVQATEPKADGGGPWASKLSSRFEDESVRGQVDAFLRDEVQPYVTRLEQGSKPSEEDQLAISLYNDLREDPSSTYLAITEELLGPEGAAAVQAALAEAYNVHEDSDEDLLEGDSEEAPDPTDPRVKAMLEDYELRQAQEAYDNAINTLKEKDPNLDPELFNPFVIAADGDIAAAHSAYQNWYSTVSEKFGTPETREEAPPVIGSDTPGTTVPPVEKTYASIDDAIDDFFLSQEQAAPPVVGGV